MLRCVQVEERFGTEGQANDALKGMTLLSTCFGGRVYKDARPRRDSEGMFGPHAFPWIVQTFHDLDLFSEVDTTAAKLERGEIGDGCSIVVIPTALIAVMGIDARKAAHVMVTAPE